MAECSSKFCPGQWKKCTGNFRVKTDLATVTRPPETQHIILTVKIVAAYLSETVVIQELKYAKR